MTTEYEPKHCTCSDESAIGCPVHDFAIPSVQQQLAKLSGTPFGPIVTNSKAVMIDAATLAIARTDVERVPRIVDGGTATFVPAIPDISAEPTPLAFLLSAAQLISDQPTTEQWTAIKDALRQLARS